MTRGICSCWGNMFVLGKDVHMVRLAGQVSMFIFSYPLVNGSLIGHPLAKKLSTELKTSFPGKKPEMRTYEHVNISMANPITRKYKLAVKDSFSGNNPGYEYGVELSETHHLNM